MKKLLPAFLSAAMPAVAAPPTDFDARVKALRRSIGLPRATTTRSKENSGGFYE